jgi:hypothetical protein
MDEWADEKVTEHFSVGFQFPSLTIGGLISLTLV